MPLDTLDTALTQLISGMEAGALTWIAVHLAYFLWGKWQCQPPTKIAALVIVASGEPSDAAALPDPVALPIPTSEEPSRMPAGVHSLSVRRLRALAQRLALPGAARLRKQDQARVFARLTALALL